MKDPHDIRKAAIEDAIIARSEEASSKLFCFKCGDGSTPLYCFNCANDELQAKCERLEGELASGKEYTESLAKDICTMEDALGFKNDCHDKDGVFIPTLGPFLERVRDLIASEGELGDAKSRLEEARRLLTYVGVYTSTGEVRLLLKDWFDLRDQWLKG